MTTISSQGYAGRSTDSAKSSFDNDSPTRPVAIDPSLFRPEPVQPVQPVQPVRAALPERSLAPYRTGMDQIRFWVGTALAAAIAAIASLVGMLLITGVLHVFVPVHTGAYALLAASIVIGLSALYNLMLHVAPHPAAYFGALAAVGIALAVLLPFTVPGLLYSQIAFSALNLVVGLLIAFLVPMAVVAARR